MSNKEIAVKLSIALNTVKKHVQRLCEKTGATSRLALAMQVMKEKLSERSAQ
jgi:DNA-binding NarL/FixJ family response regulator